MAHHRLDPQEVLSIRVGSTARATILEAGLRPRDVVALAAAAGGPKGLGLLGLDQFLFNDWLKRERPLAPRLLVGASIGAWRFAAASRLDASASLQRLMAAYTAQRYEARPSETVVSDACRGIVSAIDQGGVTHDRNYRLAVVTARAKGLLATRYSKARFGAAALSNVRARERLANYFERVVFTEGPLEVDPFDAFGLTTVALTEQNRTDALLASGTIPLVAAPVRDPAGAPPGLYWDGGLIDYHLAWPWQQQKGLVLYPHFVDHVVPGWLDKSLFWRRAGGPATDNLVVIAPSAKFLATLPGGHLPERQDFYRFKQNHDARIAQWREIIKRCEALADAFLLFANDPQRFSMQSFKP
jgi:predicted acylesterase/phospholipase RssA